MERNKNYRDLNRKEIAILDRCKCPACKSEGLHALRKSFTLRALHNAWVYQREIEKIRKLVANDEYGEYAEKILHDRFGKLVNFIKQMRGDRQ